MAILKVTRSDVFAVFHEQIIINFMSQSVCKDIFFGTL